jgi:hypothetical protein
MPDSTPAEAEQQTHPFDPAVPERIRAFLEAFADPEHPQGAISTLRSEGLRLTVDDLAQLLERDAYAERTRLELAEKCADYRHQRDEARTILDRVTAQMQEYAKHGSGSVNVRQVLSLLSPTWPDGNYEAPRGPREVRLMRTDDAVRGITSTCGACGTQISPHGHDGLSVGYVTDLGLRCGECCGTARA